MLGLGRSTTRVMPSVGSGRYSPGPGTVKLLEEGIYQEIRQPVAYCSLIRPDFLAIESDIDVDGGKPEANRYEFTVTGHAPEGGVMYAFSAPLTTSPWRRDRSLLHSSASAADA